MRLTLACADYDRTRPVLDGRVLAEGCELEVQSLDHEDMFQQALGHAPFDATELSFSRFALRLARGETPYIGIPVFLSRAFRHSAIYVRDTVREPRDLRGKRIGVRDYSNTVSLVARGMLEDEYGVAAREVRWVVGDIDHDERDDIRLPALAPGFDVHAEKSRLLADLLVAGELDGLIDFQPPRCFEEGDARVRRLFPDHETAERDYFARTGIFPIMHLLCLKRAVAERAPWVAQSLYRAFAAAKDAALADLCTPAAPKISLPWISEAHARTVQFMGKDLWPYGIAANRTAIEAIPRYLVAQGLAPRRPAMDELFAASVLST